MQKKRRNGHASTKTSVEEEIAHLRDLQMTISLLSMQSRNSANPEVAAQLAAAANRVSMIAESIVDLTPTKAPKQ